MKSYFQVITASVAKANRHLDIGDIQEINELGRIIYVNALSGNRVEVQEMRGRKVEHYVVGDAFISRGEAEARAVEVIDKEIQRLHQKALRTINAK